MNNTYKTITFTLIALIVGVAIGSFSGDRGFSSRASYNKNMMMHKMPDGSMMQNSMENMMHDMNANLKGRTGDAFDRAFLSEMIVHHEGAVDMAKLVLGVSKRPELLKLANDIISAQTQEIEMMNTWSKAWFGASSSGTSEKKEDVVMCTMDAKACPDGSYVGRKGPNCEFEACPGK